ncbi:MAG: transcription termination factor NusA, partial [Candidatus Nanoarchaeia archaeon]
TKAQAIKPDAKVGDIITVEVKPSNLGRIAAQTARQVMMQQLRKAEKAIVQQEFKEKMNQIVSGVVRRIEAGNMIVDMQKAEGILRKEDQIPGERYSIGDRINAVIKEIEAKGSGPSLHLSRSCNEFVLRLFEREVAEIHNGIVVIKGIAREPGSRTKIAVFSNDPHVDAIGACVGVRGMRVKNIMNEMSGEKIDIIEYNDDIKVYVANAIQPAMIKGIDVNEDTHSLVLKVNPDQFALALGKKGQNLRLTTKLTGWKIDIVEIKEELPFEQKLANAIENLAKHLGVSNDTAEKLARKGYLTIDGLMEAESSDIEAIEGIQKEELNTVLIAIQKFKASAATTGKQ